ncbi:MAG: four helix bundle protein [Paludibacteraceae bacterium]
MKNSDWFLIWVAENSKILQPTIFEQAMKTFKLSLTLPKDERYLLTDQIRHFSRSICKNIGKAYCKRAYSKLSHSKMTDYWGENGEISLGLNFSFCCNCTPEEIYKQHTNLTLKYED